MRDPHPHLSSSESNEFSKAADRAIELHVAEGHRGVVVRALFQLGTWLALAWGIVHHELNWLLVLAPWILEFQLMLWFGPPLAHFIVREPVFIKNSGRWLQALTWSAVLLLPPALVILIQHDVHFDAAIAFVQQSIAASPGNGVALACGLATLGLVVDTARDVTTWRSVGGVFAWPATMRLGMRMIALFVVLFVGFFVFAAIGSLTETFGTPWNGFASPSGAAWTALAIVVFADLGELLISVLLIRKSRKAQRDDAVSG